MRHASVVVCVMALLAGSASAATMWTGTTSNNWSTPTNWNPTGVPDIHNGVDDATIPDGSTVEWTPGGDWSNNATVTLNGNSSWTQLGGGSWARIAGNGGTGKLILNDTSLFDAGTANRVVVGIVSGANGTVEINDSAELDTDGVGFTLAYDSNTQGRADLDGGTLTVGGEFWFGRDTGGQTSQTAIVSMNGSDVTASGTVGIWFWDPHTTGSTMYIDFTGTSQSTVTVSDRFGRRNAGGSSNVMTWETAWNEGLIRVDGGNAGNFSDYFTTSGTSSADGQSYTLTYIPEPTTLALAAVGLLGVARRRRRKE